MSTAKRISAVCIGLIAFAACLLFVAPALAQTNVTFTVSADTDDADEISDGTVYVTDGSSYLNGHVGFRFQNVTIPAGATITNATLEVYSNGNEDASFSVDLAAQDHDNPSTFSTANGNITSRSLTSAQTLWSTGTTTYSVGQSLTSPNLASSIQEVVDRSGWSSGNALVVITTPNSGNKGIFKRSGAPSFAPKLHVTYSTVSIGELLLVIGGGTPNSEETARKTQFEAWGYNVTTIEDAASQASFDAALAAADAAYVAGTIQDWELLYKLRNASCGVVSERPGLDLEFGFATSDGYTQSWHTLESVDNSHAVTAGLSSGDVVIFSSSQQTSINGNTIAAGMQVLGTMNFGTTALGAIDAGGALANSYNGNNTASGRRVRLPWANITWSALNSSGQAIARQALAWATGAADSGARYALDETSGSQVTDSSGSGRHGAYVGSPQLGVSAPRNLGSRFSAPGTTDMITLPSTVLDGADSLTVGFWIRTSATSEQTIVSGANSTQNNEFKFAFLDDTTVEVVINGAEVTQSIDSIATDEWIHFAVAIDDSSTKIYRDGKLIGTMSSHGTGGTLSIQGLVVGQDQDSVLGGYQSTQRLIGSIDDLAVYRSTLAEVEIAELHGLIAHWKLDETSGANANDSSLSNNDAALTGTQGWTTGSDGGGHVFDYADGEDYFQAPNNSGLDDVQEGDYTVMAYFKPNSLPPGSGSDNDGMYAIVSKNGYHLGIKYDSSGQFFNEHWLESGPTWAGAGAWGESYAPGHFYHVAATVSRTNGVIKFYVDGELKGTDTFTPGTGPWDYGTNRWRIGISQPSASNWGHACDGIVDDARIYNRVLGDDEIAQFSAQGLVGHWKLDETSGTTATDLSNINNDGAYANSPMLGQNGPYPGLDNASRFNGTSNYVDIPDKSAYSPSTSSGLSVAAWVKVLSVNTDGHSQLRQPIVSKGDVNQYEWALYVNDNGNAGFNLWTSGGSDHSTANGGELPIGVWVHVVGTFEPGVATRIHVNGQQVGVSSSFYSSISNGTANVRIASRIDGQFLNADIADVRIYRQVLTPTEIAELYGLIGHWKFDEGAGGVAADSTAFGNHASLSGATWSFDCNGQAALEFDGAGDTAATSASFDPPAMGAVAFWFRSAGTPASRQRPWGVGSDFEMWQDNDGLLSCDLSTDGFQGGFITDDPLDRKDHWYHVVAQYDAADDSFDIYVNGELHKSGVSTWDIVKQPANLLTFGTRTGNAEYWEGAMRDFRVYNRRLLDVEISEISDTAGRWRLDESSGFAAVDATVLANDGTHVNGPTLGATSVYAPENGAAVAYDGANDYTEIPHNDAMLADNGTVMFWFRSTAPATTQGLISKDSQGYDDGGHLTIRLVGGKINVQLQSTSTDYEVESSPVAANKWRHVAFTWGTSGMNLYIDGRPADSDPSYTGGLGGTSGGAGNHEPIVIGANAWVSGNLTATPVQDHLHGVVDDVGFYTRALCPAEIYRRYRSSRSPGVRIVNWLEVR